MKAMRSIEDASPLYEQRLLRKTAKGLTAIEATVPNSNSRYSNRSIDPKRRRFRVRREVVDETTSEASAAFLCNSPLISRALEKVLETDFEI